MKKLIPFFLIFVSSNLFAQIPEDVLRYSYFPQNGTARTLAIGGAMGSLGGDITATFVNPAGLGNYKTGEIVLTPGLFFNSNKVDFRNTKLSNNNNSFGLGPIGIVFGSPNRYKPGNSTAFSIAVTQTANFNNTVSYKGLNNISSYSEQWTEAIANSGAEFANVLNNPSFAYGAAPAVLSFLVDTFRINGNLLLKSLPELLIDNQQALLQEKTIATRGGIYEIGLGFASNSHDKLLIGGTLGIPIVNYQNTTTFRESDTSITNNNNGFNYFNYTDNFSTTGAGANLKLGIIYRPQERIRLGLAVHTPTYMFSLTDKRNTVLQNDTENYNGEATVASGVFTGNQPGESKYTMLTPWKVMVSGSYVFREIENVKRQRAFVTADIEYVTNGSSGFYSSNEAPGPEELKYFKDLRTIISNQYKGNFNFRVGGELKFNVFMARLGFAHYTNPYKDAALKANRTLLSGGIGYRNKGFFIDLTYVHSFNKEVDFAYRLQDKPNTFASINNQRGNVVASVGFKF